jgi:hypothetical protein
MGYLEANTTGDNTFTHSHILLATFVVNYISDE